MILDLILRVSGYIYLCRKWKLVLPSLLLLAVQARSHTSMAAAAAMSDTGVSSTDPIFSFLQLCCTLLENFCTVVLTRGLPNRKLG